jgi:hypothetical protein
MIRRIIVSLLLTSPVLALQGVIKVLEAPIQYKQSEDSPILQEIRKGTVIFINENSIENDLYYKTVTRDGMDGYVLKDYVKLIYKDANELDDNIAVVDDPTDYIIDEPIPADYPFAPRRTNKAYIHFNYGQGTSSSYNYSSTREREQINNSASLELKYLRRADFDKENRFYYGFHLGGKTGRNEFQLSNEIFSTETHTTFSAGPVVNYTFYRAVGFEIDTSLQFGFNFHKSFVKIEDIPNNEAEERSFNGFSLSGTLATVFTHKEIFDSRNLDFIHGPAINFNMPYNLTNSAQAEVPRLWTSDNFKVETEFTFAYIAGFMLRY